MIGRICRIFAACREGRQIPVGRQVCGTLLLLLFGVASGVFAKFLDTTPANVLPRVLEVPDIRNVLSRFAVWALIALCIAVYSSRALRASLNVSVFFAGMLAGYYVYTAAAGEIRLWQFSSAFVVSCVFLPFTTYDTRCPIDVC